MRYLITISITLLLSICGAAIVAAQEQLPFGLLRDDDWASKDRQLPIVITVHGYNSHPMAPRGLISDLPELGFRCGAFHYPDDQGVAESARLLSTTLKQLSQEFPDQAVNLVTHSMGGLVAREATENAALDPGNVKRLIMVSPPTHGSSLARIAFVTEFLEFAMDPERRRQDPEQRSFLLGALENILADASIDLRPGSVFLTQLNSRPLNPSVRYSLFLGSVGFLTQEDMDRVRGRVLGGGASGGQSSENRWVRMVRSRMEAYLQDLDELIDDKGDGVVSIARGKLAGVEDSQILNYNHVGILARDQDEGGLALRGEIKKRVME